MAGLHPIRGAPERPGGCAEAPLLIAFVDLMRFAAQTTPDEIGIFLGLVGPASARPLSEELTSAGVLNINLQHVDYSEVKMTSDLSEPAAPARSARAARFCNHFETVW